MSAKVQCKQCGGNLEKERADWATPVCFACLPPPAPLPVVWPKSFAKALAEARVEGKREGLQMAAAYALWCAKEMVKTARQYGHDLRSQDNDVTQLVLAHMDTVILCRKMAREVKS